MNVIGIGRLLCLSGAPADADSAWKEKKDKKKAKGVCSCEFGPTLLEISDI